MAAEDIRTWSPSSHPLGPNGCCQRRHTQSSKRRYASQKASVIVVPPAYLVRAGDAKVHLRAAEAKDRSGDAVLRKLLTHRAASICFGRWRERGAAGIVEMSDVALFKRRRGSRRVSAGVLRGMCRECGMDVAPGASSDPSIRWVGSQRSPD